MSEFRAWLAFLTAQLLESCLQKCKRDCPACTDGLICPLLHYHTRFNTKEVLERYMPEASSELLQNIDHYYSLFVSKFEYYYLEDKEYITKGGAFLQVSSPEAIFYGNYINKHNDATLYGPLEQVEPIKVKPQKSSKKRKNDTPGDSEAASST